ncbi:MAG: branched-chain amino acid aminotransferase [Erysipelotrichales bacterium]
MNRNDIKFVENKNKKEKPLAPPPFGSTFTNYMFHMKYNEEDGWHNPVIKPFDNFEVNPAALCFHYGQTIFEGLKVIKKNGKRVLFRPDANYNRMNDSAKRMCMPQIDVDFAIEATQLLIEKENDEWFYDVENSSVYIRPFMFASYPSLNVIDSPSYEFFIILSPMNTYFSAGKVKLRTETNYMRAASKGTGEIKNGGNYGGSFRAASDAKDEGYSQVLWLDSKEQKYVEEAGMMNVFFVVENKLYTPKLNGSILKGITRDSVIKVAPELGYEVVEDSLDINELVNLYKQGKLTEIFSSGTAASVQSLDTLVHNNFEMNFENENNIAKSIYNHLESIKDGSKPDHHNFIRRF